MRKHLFVGGLTAAGVDPSGSYLLTLSHSGRGVFTTESWERVARDTQDTYPEAGFVRGIGPIDGVLLPVKEIDYGAGHLRFDSPDGRFRFEYEDGMITISDSPPQTAKMN